MLIFAALAIPVVFLVGKLIFFRNKLVWWEFIIPFLASVICVVVAKSTIGSYQVSDTEFWGDYRREAVYYEGWDEWIEDTCTRTWTDSEGNEHSEDYDCSYSREHAPYWEVLTNTGTRIEMEEGSTWGFTSSWATQKFPGFEAQAKQWGQRKRLNMSRDYYTIDGDAYVTAWPGTEETLVPVSTSHTYENKVAVADTVYKFEEVTAADIKQYGLFDYPPIRNYYQQQILGPGGASMPRAERLLQIANAKLGAPKKVRMFILIYKNQPLDASHKQEALWRGGNKNEFVLTIGIDNNDAVTWARAFSWTEVESLKIGARDYMVETFVNPKRELDLVPVVNWVARNISSDWVRKNFRDFDYITVPPPLWAVILTFVVTLVVNLGASAWTVLNGIDAEGHRGPQPRFRRY